MKTEVHGFTLTYEEDAAEGAHYLGGHLDVEEARVFFDQARERGHCEFEDHQNRRFILSHHNASYDLRKR